MVPLPYSSVPFELILFEVRLRLAPLVVEPPRVVPTAVPAELKTCDPSVIAPFALALVPLFLGIAIGVKSEPLFR